jgi:hypothetical protein
MSRQSFPSPVRGKAGKKRGKRKGKNRKNEKVGKRRER